MLSLPRATYIPSDRSFGPSLATIERQEAIRVVSEYHPNPDEAIGRRYYSNSPVIIITKLPWHRKIGGIHWLRIGRLRVSWCWARQ